MSDVKRLYAIRDLATRWTVSPYTVRRLITCGELRSITIGARRLVPLAEIERAEQFGVGKPRKDARTGAAAIEERRASAV